MERNMTMRASLLLSLIVVPVLAAGPADVEDFAFVQITDSHLSPYLARMDNPPALRGAEAIAWICEHAAGPQSAPEVGLEASSPMFAIATGDLTEYGVIDKTWAQFKEAFSALPYPIYALPGNHDNTWVAMYEVLRRRHGGENHSFDHGGCHFACISSASPQEPVPTIDGKTRAWLKDDLDSLASGTPVFIALHHPIYSREFANPAEYETLIDMLRDYNVALLIYGHGHNISHQVMDGIDGVMGGTTYGKRAGYAVYSIQDDILRVAYHYHTKPEEADTGWRRVLEKPLRREVPRRLFELNVTDVRAGGMLTFNLRPRKGVGVSDLADVEVRIDGEVVTTSVGGVAGHYECDVTDLRPGRHLLCVRAAGPDGKQDLRTAFFTWVPRDEWVFSCFSVEAAVKAGPVIVDDMVVVARTDGVVAAYAHGSNGPAPQAIGATCDAEPKVRWTYEAGAEVLGTPVWTGSVLVFGSGDGVVHAIDRSGKPVWRREVGAPVYGWPVVDDGVVYIGDNQGRMHAFDVQTGELRWMFERADYAIEAAACVWGDRVVFGAWDGYLYALRGDSGEQAWKVYGPKSSEGRAARYYAPADCGPVVVDDALFVCDRGYVLGRYDREGQLLGTLDGERISGIVPAPLGGVYARGFDDKVYRINRRGEVVWKTDVAAGRFPIPPTVRNGLVYVCSNRGLLSALDAESGSVRWQIQVTPGFYVMAPVAVAADGTCYVASMAGEIVAVRPR